MSNRFILTILLLPFFSCSNNGADQDVLVSVFDYKLTKQEVVDQLDNSLSAEDSLAMSEKIIENWVQNKMLVAQAERNLSDSLKNFTKELEAEKNSLLIYTYENHYLSQKMDTVVSIEEIEEYYDSNKSSFVLSNYILKYSFIEIPIGVQDISKNTISSGFRNFETENNQEPLREYCSEIGASMTIDTTNWKDFREFSQAFSLSVFSAEQFLKKQKMVDYETENFRYFVYIHDYGLENEISPLELVKNKIRSLILNRRKQTTIKNLRKDLFQKAVRENHIKYHQ